MLCGDLNGKEIQKRRDTHTHTHMASQVALVVKNPPDGAGEIRDISQ